MDWWGLPDAVATAGKLFEYRLDQLTDDGDDDDDYGSATGDQPRQLTLDVYQVSSSSSDSFHHCRRRRRLRLINENMLDISSKVNTS